MFARREEERAALSRHAPLANGIPIPQKEEHVSRKETSRGSVNICVSHLGTNLGRHKIGTRQQGLQSSPGNSTVMGIIRNNFSHTSYCSARRGFSPREVGQSGRDRVKRESNARIARCGKVEKWVNHQKEEERKAKSSTNVRWPSNGSNAPPAQHSWKLRILRLVQRKWLPTPISRLLSPNLLSRGHFRGETRF